MTTILKTKSALSGITVGLRALAFGILSGSSRKYRCARLLLLLSLCLTGLVFAAQALFTDGPATPTYELLTSFGTPSTGAYPNGGLIKGTDGQLYGTANQGGSRGYGVVFKLNADGSGFTVLKGDFDFSTTGGYLYSRLMQGTDGALYGTANQGGSSGYGTVFKLNTDGSGFKVLKNFDYSTTGAYPYSGLIQGTDGALYGTSQQGGRSGYGTVFKLNTDGSGFTVLKGDFDNSTTGGYLYSGLMQGTDGALYGTAYQGGSSGYGTVFKLNPDGSGFTVVKGDFDYSMTGGYLYSGLMQGTDGALYGTAYQGGSSGYGTVFKLNPDGSGFTVLKNFDYSMTGGYLYSGLMQGTDGALYGTAFQGGGGGGGTVFKLNTDGSGFTILKGNFDYSTTGGDLYTGLMQGTDGALYGTAIQGGRGGHGTMFKLNTDGSGFTVLKNYFSGPNIADSGGYLYSGVIQGTDGALYGTANQGGSRGYGVVFKLNTDGSGFTVLKGDFDYSTTGGYLYSRLMQGTDGALYGTAQQGGSSGYGTVFKLNTDGSGFKVLKNFDYSTTGGYLYSGLMQGTDGALYGTAQQGGSSSYGTVFKLNTDGSGFKVLKNFDYSTTGAYLYSGLMQGTDGALYGTAYQGGSSGYGTVFKLNPDGSGFTVVKGDFDYSMTGGNLYSGLMQGTDGALYGTAYQGGSSGYGVVFKLNTDGSSFTVLKNFDYSTTGGNLQGGGLQQRADGKIYGTAYQGGSNGAGTVFQMNPDGTDFSVFLNFDNSANGGYPFGTLSKGTDGNLYGTTSQGGDAHVGTVFRLLFAESGPANLPPVAKCKNVTVSAGANGTANASIDDGSSDPDTGDIITVTQSPAGPYGLGNTLVTLAVTDSHGASSECTATVTVVDDTAPVITGCPGNITVQTGPGRATCDQVATWTAPTARDNCNVASFTSNHLPGDTFPVGTTTVTYTATDGANPANTITCSFTVTVQDNTPPVIPSLAKVTGQCSAFVTAPTTTDNCAGMVTGTTGDPLVYNSQGTFTVHWTFSDGHGNSSTANQTVFVQDTTAPAMVCPSNKSVNADPLVGTAVVSGIGPTSAGDNCSGYTIAYTLTGATTGSGANNASGRTFNLGTTAVTYTITDIAGLTASCRFTVAVVNPVPVVSLTGPASGSLYAINTPVNFRATFTDAGGGMHTGTWMLDSISQAAAIVEPSGATPGSAKATYTFPAPGVYTVKLTVNDSCGSSCTATQIGGMDLQVVVYDPSSGFATGDGWINSPVGAYVANPSLTGKANFGFVSKYHDGQSIPTGETEFQLHGASFHFRSTSHQWLVVSGAKAQYKGFGQINGTGDYGFLLTATDGQLLNGGGVDRFRIKIWNRTTSVVVYDNAMGSPEDLDLANPLAIGGGSIEVASGHSSCQHDASTSGPKTDSVSTSASKTVHAASPPVIPPQRPIIPHQLPAK